jgi:hypothetical protein
MHNKNVSVGYIQPVRVKKDFSDAMHIFFTRTIAMSMPRMFSDPTEDGGKFAMVRAASAETECAL